jgi:hypothetical protein
MRQTQATVMAKQIAYDAARVADVYFEPAGTISGTFIPTGGTVVQRQYGQEYAGDFEFYTKKRHVGLIVDNQLQISGVDYDIVAVRDYVKAITVLLKKAVG